MQIVDAYVYSPKDSPDFTFDLYLPSRDLQHIRREERVGVSYPGSRDVWGSRRHSEI